MQCQINKLISKSCQNEAVENIDLSNTAKGDVNLWVCQQHLQQLIHMTTKQTPKQTRK